MDAMLARAMAAGGPGNRTVIVIDDLSAWMMNETLPLLVRAALTLYCTLCAPAPCACDPHLVLCSMRTRALCVRPSPCVVLYAHPRPVRAALVT